MAAAGPVWRLTAAAQWLEGAEVLVRLIQFLMFGGFVVAPLAATAQIPAFPGADGAAANVSGGRGGLVYHVTKLDTTYSDTALGTLHYGLNDANFPKDASGNVQPRTIVFDVGGTIWLGRFAADTEGWDSQDNMSAGSGSNASSNITIAGQTAPGGITIAGGGLKLNGKNIIVRNVTIAPGYGTRNIDPVDGLPDSYVYDAMNIANTNIMVDHVSAVFTTDETISADERAASVTIQYSNIAQGQNYPQWDAEGGGYTGHSLGSLLQAGSNAAISVHHNLYAHLKGRLPRVGSEVGTGAYNDFRNNVFYNWLGTAGAGDGGQPPQPSFNNFVGNFYLAGPGGDDASGSTYGSPVISSPSGGTGIFNGGNSSVTRVYHSGNLRDTNKDGDANDGTALTNSNFSSSSIQANPYTQVPYTGVTDTATDSYNRVLNYVGANWWARNATIDSIDERIINEVRTGTGKIIAWNDPTHGTEWNALLGLRFVGGVAPYNRPVNYDTDADGMPNVWETAHGLNPSVAEDSGDFDSDGYTNLEEYLNEVAEWPAPKPIVFNAAANNRYAQITNWDIQWQPSKYDEAQINAGAVVVDAVGQHAGTLKIATNNGNTAQLNVTAGWLRVEDEVVIGTNLSKGTLDLSGGLLSTHALSKGSGGSFNFTGGTLQADVVNFDLVNNGGTIAPGLSPGLTVVNGDLTLNGGSLEIEIGGTQSGQYDRLEVHGVTTLGATLKVKLIESNTGPYVPQLGDTFAFLAAFGGGGGEFDAFDLPQLAPGLAWAVLPGDVAIFLSIVAAPGLAGDYNNDQIVDAADYVVWRNSIDTQTPLANETASPGVVDAADYEAWRANFGAAAGSGSVQVATLAVPEPEALLMALIFAANLPTFWHKITRRRRSSRSCAQARASCSACPSERY